MEEPKPDITQITTMRLERLTIKPKIHIFETKRIKEPALFENKYLTKNKKNNFTFSPKNLLPTKNFYVIFSFCEHSNLSTAVSSMLKTVCWVFRIVPISIFFSLFFTTYKSVVTYLLSFIKHCQIQKQFTTFTANTLGPKPASTSHTRKRFPFSRE